VKTRRRRFLRAASSEMKPRFRRSNERRRVATEPTSDSAFFVAALVLGFAMLTLFAVLALADPVGLADILPFFAIPAALFVASAVAAWRWATGESETAVVREVDDRESVRARQGR
jgi:hypothetical protein